MFQIEVVELNEICIYVMSPISCKTSSTSFIKIDEVPVECHLNHASH